MDLLWQQPRRNTLVSWPKDVDQRLDILVRVAVAAGEQTSRSQILAALVATAEANPDAVAELLHAYRRLASDALAADNERPDLPTVRVPGPTRAQ
ncbi:MULTISPECIES: hypothetical protein [Streptomyces]|uniref:ANTAR domain-containing protein n=1 Tax=Streptomyces dengpaensis TaxID=2049881 RepID=A0ABM6SIM3_9ACTN|nr:MULTISPECIES: hypothetical protein [Streptomyces]AVH54496.1 hypothetical protein C4B68_00035 [Streptomyces dengpaensis]PIB00237.1 hypothetical protein B1C81_38920 [Streptomyces sp. HG99]